MYSSTEPQNAQINARGCADIVQNTKRHDRTRTETGSLAQNLVVGIVGINLLEMCPLLLADIPELLATKIISNTVAE